MVRTGLLDLAQDIEGVAGGDQERIAVPEGKSRAAGSARERSKETVCSCPEADRRMSLAWLCPAFSVNPPATVRPDLAKSEASHRHVTHEGELEGAVGRDDDQSGQVLVAPDGDLQDVLGADPVLLDGARGLREGGGQRAGNQRHYEERDPNIGRNQ